MFVSATSGGAVFCIIAISIAGSVARKGRPNNSRPGFSKF
jgi:hypothetical protein